MALVLDRPGSNLIRGPLSIESRKSDFYETTLRDIGMLFGGVGAPFVYNVVNSALNPDQNIYLKTGVEVALAIFGANAFRKIGKNIGQKFD